MRVNISQIASFTKNCGVKSILQTEPALLKSIQPPDLRFSSPSYKCSMSKSPSAQIKKSLIKELISSVKSLFKRDPVKKEIFNSLVPGHKEFNLERAKVLLKEKTGLNLHIACSDELLSFAQTPGKVIKYIDKGKFPKEIKHVLLGHGTGSTIDDTWVISGTNEKVFDYINRNIPKGEKALVCCCEETPKKLLQLLPKGKAGIGHVVHTELSTASRPAKIVESGRNEIIGDFAKGQVHYYN